MKNGTSVMTFVEDPNHSMQPVLLSRSIYQKAIEAFVIVCADVVLLNPERHTIFLTKRRHKPMNELWIIGGRIMAGESEFAAIQRKFKHETSLEIEHSRFKFLTMVRYFCEDRQQEPQNRGSDNLSYTFTLELTPGELLTASRSLDPDEYDKSFGLKEFTREDLLAAKVNNAILYFYDLIFPETETPKS